MAYVMNIAKGKVAGYFDRVKSGDPSTSRLLLVPLAASGLQAQGTVQDYDTLAAIVAGSTEQTTMGRKTITGASLTATAPDDTNNRMDADLPSVTWSAASGAAIGAIVVCYVPVTGTSTDSQIIPLVVMEITATPDGNDLILNAGTFFRAS